jgi:hypothetical protein
MAKLTMSQENIHVDELEPGPIRQTELTPALVSRVKAIHLALDEVYPSSLADWLDDFRRDVHPEGEIVWWEGLAQCYLEYRDSRELSGVQRQIAFRILLNISMGGSPAMLLEDLAALPEGALAVLQAALQAHGL